MSSLLLVNGSYHLASKAIPTTPCWLCWDIRLDFCKYRPDNKVVRHCYNKKYLEVLLIATIRCGMWQKNVVSYNVGLNRWFPLSANQMPKNGASSRRLDPQIEALDGHSMWLVESHPVLHSIAKGFETNSSIVFEVFSAVEAVQLLLVSFIRPFSNTNKR